MPLNRSLLLPVCLAKRIMGISWLPAETRMVQLVLIELELALADL